jgi:glycosyltransferase involved in cell wall biosynthesis
MHVLIVAHYFPPLLTVGANRPHSWARYWSRHGHEITVLTTRKYPIDGPANANARLEMNDLGVRVIEVDYLAGSSFTEGSSFAEGSSTAAQPKVIAATFLRKMLRQLRRSIIGPLVDPRSLWLRPALRALDAAFPAGPRGSARFDAVVTTYGPAACHVIGSRLAERGVPWIADYRDLWADHPYPGVWPFSAVTRMRERRTMSGATHLTTTSVEWRETLQQRFDLPATVIENGFDAELAGRLDEADVRGYLPQSHFNIVYTGTIYSGDRDPTPLFAALQNLAEQQPGLNERLRLTFFGDSESLAALAARYPRLQQMIRIEPPVSLKTSLTIQRYADALLFLDWSRPIDGWLTAKLYEYMSSGTPILAVGGALRHTASRLIKDSKTGIALGNNVGLIQETLTRMLQGSAFLYEPDASFLATMTREALALKMLDVVQQTVNHARDARMSDS